MDQYDTFSKNLSKRKIKPLISCFSDIFSKAVPYQRCDMDKKKTPVNKTSQQ